MVRMPAFQAGHGGFKSPQGHQVKGKSMKLSFPPDKVFFTSDTHFGHKNIIRHCNRPFKGTEEMFQTIKENWNNKVGKEDTIFILGDLFFRCSPSYASHKFAHLNGRKILVRGNHDSSRMIRALSDQLEGVYDLVELTVTEEKQVIILCHYAMRTWNKSHRGAWHLFGHTHGRLGPYGKSFDVGVDANDFTPLSYWDVKNEMEKLNGK